MGSGRRTIRIALAVAGVALGVLLSGQLAAQDAVSTPVDFARDVYPLLAAKCFACHGADLQEGQLRLDARSAALRGGVSGVAVEAGAPDRSLLIRRVLGQDDLDRMPLDEEPLSDAEIVALRKWVEQGASWPDGVGAEIAVQHEHWAYRPPQRPALPTVARPDWTLNPLDYFVLAKLEERQWQPAPPADRAVLLRRVYLDLIGIPPSVEELDAFLADPAPQAYERAVDRLLASPAYGERWARPWLDAARYADSNGYQADQYRSVWPYRDWVIRALNADMPFDQFTLWQMAGDLLPNATLEQKIATGFHRLTTCNVEAGVDPEENRIEQVVDRVNTTATVWLGTTLECAQCHNHKYDPFTQRDYYRLFAYFNNTPLEVEGDGVTYNFVGPLMSLPLAEEQAARQAKLDAELAELARQQVALGKELDAALDDWLATDPLAAMDQKPELPANVRKVLAKTTESWTKKERQVVQEFHRGLQAPYAQLTRQKAALEKQRAECVPDTTLVMIELEQPRATHILLRGDFQTPGQKVEPGTPRTLPQIAAETSNRLDLARWLTSRDNPLVARVTVNRWWSEMFGRGLVATLEDFGTRSEPPSHPELLDWLACEFRDQGWSMKHVHRLIVTSATYRQSSQISREAYERDPDNYWLARGPRFRMSAESLRDNALAVSGLLCREASGPPIFPPQPAGIWRHVGRNAPVYATSEGGERFRRGIYVFWRRSAPYPSFVNFDAPDRASCVVQRTRTNTPLQALTLLNDSAYFEIARGFAREIQNRDEFADLPDRMRFAFRSCVAREPDAEELAGLCAFWAEESARLASDTAATRELLGAPAKGDTLSPAGRAEWGAWLLVANVLLNLDETISKE